MTKPLATQTDNELLLVYDREYPICDYYCRRVDVDDSIGDLLRVDAREQTYVLDEITAAKLEKRTHQQSSLHGLSA